MKDPRSEEHKIFNPRDLHGQLIDCTSYEEDKEAYYILFIWDKNRAHMRRAIYFGDEVINLSKRKTSKVYTTCSFLHKESGILLGRYPVFSA